MVALVWGSRSAQGGSFALFHLVIVIGVGWWLLALLWLKHYHFAVATTIRMRARSSCSPAPWRWCRPGARSG